jgi:hypothetical protein
MAASGQKTMEVFKRYNTVSEEELMNLVETPVGTEPPKESSRNRLIVFLVTYKIQLGEMFHEGL